MEFKYSDRLKNLGGNAIREIFKLLSDPEVVSFAGGFPTLSTLPKDEIAEIASSLLTGERAYEILQYGGTEGFLPLRKTACKYVERYGIFDVKIDNTLIISGGQQGIDLMCKAFVNKGDVVLVENPTYLASLHILKTYEANVVGVESCDSGLDLVDLEEKIVKYSPKMIYCVPTFSNPTGRTYTKENRKAIAEISAKHNVVVLEDDPYSELRFEGERMPSMKSFDKAGNIVYITSFSKIIAPGLRTGVAVGHEEVIRKLTIGKQAVDVHTSSLSQAIINEYISRGSLDKHITEIIPIYQEKKEAMIDAINKYMPHEFSYTNPDGGLFIFGAFDEKCKINADKLFAEIVAKTKVAYVSGVSFFADGRGANTIRLNYSNASISQIYDGIKKLGNYFNDLIEMERGHINE